MSVSGVMRLRRFMTTAFLAGLPALVAAGASSAQAQTPEWTLREELRFGDRASGTCEMPGIGRVVTGRDGVAYALTSLGDLLVLEHGKQLRRVETRRLADIEAMLRDRTLEGEHRRQLLEFDIAPRQGFSWFRSGPLPPSALGWLGDTLWVIDGFTGKITLLDRAGTVTGTVPYAASIAGALADPPLALLADRSLLQSSTPRDAGDQVARPAPPPPPDQYRMPIIPAPPQRSETPPDRGYLMRVTPDGRVLQGLEIFTARRRDVMLRNHYGETATIRAPFHDEPLVATTPDGSEVVFVERYWANEPGPASYSVARFDVGTGKRTARRYTYAPTPTGLSVDSAVSALVDRADSPLGKQFLLGFRSRSAARVAIREALSAPAFHAPVTAVIAGADHTVWLREQSSGHWIVLARDGSVRARVALPAGARLVHADAETIWAAFDRAVGGAGSCRLLRYRVLEP